MARFLCVKRRTGREGQEEGGQEISAGGRGDEEWI